MSATMLLVARPRKGIRDSRRPGGTAFSVAAQVCWSSQCCSCCFCLIQHVHLSELWAMVIGSWFGALVAGWVLVPDLMLPGWIGNWQEGAWGGEENTATVLRRLKRKGWTVRHDVKAGDGPWNRDHIVAGGSVFLIDTKNKRQYNHGRGQDPARDPHRRPWRQLHLRQLPGSSAGVLARTRVRGEAWISRRRTTCSCDLGSVSSRGNLDW